MESKCKQVTLWPKVVAIRFVIAVFPAPEAPVRMTKLIIMQRQVLIAASEIQSSLRLPPAVVLAESSGRTLAESASFAV
jgi:hypothetical protein